MSNSSAVVNSLEKRVADDGFAIVDLLNEEAIRSLRSAYKTLTGSSGDGFQSTILSRDTQYRKAVNAAIMRRIKAPIKSILAGYRIAFCTFAAKSANSAESEVAIHQDWSFVDEDRYTSMGLWCPLQDVNRDNGCLQIVGGSHASAHPPRAAFTTFAYPELEAQLRENHLRSMPMSAGQAMLFDNRLFHCSPPNRSDTERIAATAVIVPTSSQLRYYHVADKKMPNLLEVFEVDDSFYLMHNAPERPQVATSLGLVNTNDFQ